MITLFLGYLYFGTIQTSHGPIITKILPNQVAKHGLILTKILLNHVAKHGPIITKILPNLVAKHF